MNDEAEPLVEFIIHNSSLLMLRNLKTTLEMIKIEHTLFALPFAFLGAVLAAKYHGILTGKTGEDPRTETFNKNSRGVLSSMKCTVDSDAGNDTPSIGCSAIQLASVQLDLVNTQDVQADKWTAPPVNNQVVIPKGIQSSGVYAEIVKKAVIGKSRKLVLPKQQRCNRGLVSVGGECVPQLKR